MARRDRDQTRGATRRAVVRTLRRVARALERGERVRVQVRGERVEVPAGALWSVEHERQGAREELEIQARWRRPGRRPAGARGRGLV